MRSNPRARVLCIEDDEDSRVALVTLLKLALIEAKAVGTAAQALSLIQAERFDLYLLDSRLPFMGWSEVSRSSFLRRRTPLDMCVSAHTNTLA